MAIRKNDDNVIIASQLRCEFENYRKQHPQVGEDGAILAAEAFVNSELMGYKDYRRTTVREGNIDIYSERTGEVLLSTPLKRV